MKQTNQDAKSKIISFLSKNPNSDAKAIEKGTKIPRAIVFSTIRELDGAKQVSTFQKGAKSVKLFSAVVMPSVEKAKKAVETVETAKPVDKKVETNEGKNFGRDFSKYQINGVELRKGKSAHAIVKFVAEKKNCNFKQLLELFPSELVRNYGVFTEAANARKMNGTGKQRYFCQADQLIKLKDGAVVAVTNQIGSNNIGAIVEIGRANGCKIVEPTV